MLDPFGGSDDAVLAELGARLARVRLDRNLTQEALAADAGVSVSTLRRLEAGHSTQLTALLRVLRSLDLLANLDLLVPAPEIRPLEVLERGRHVRRRASSPSRSPAEPDRPWTWGEDR